MSTISRWVIPCYFSADNQRVDPITFDLTDHLKLFFANEVWNRKFHYGYAEGLKNTKGEEIIRASLTIYPRFFSGIVNKKRIPQGIEKICGKIPGYFNVNSYKSWAYQNGFTVIETEYSYSLNNIPSKDDLIKEYVPHYEMEFIETFDRHLAVIKEVSAFFLSSVHLSFPTHSVIMRSHTSLNDGFLQIVSNGNSYCSSVATNAYMHEVLLEKNKLSTNLTINMKALASIWHYNLWSIKRFLSAVESDQLSMDNLLDLLYALEGLFEKNASSDFIKTMCLIKISKNRKDAISTMNILDVAYRIRNEIAHGGISYDVFDYVELEGKNILAQEIYWKMKGIVAFMIIEAISKVLSSKQVLKNLRFNDVDLINSIFTSDH